jgi:hypothetical protein
VNLSTQGMVGADGPALEITTCGVSLSESCESGPECIGKMKRWKGEVKVWLTQRVNPVLSLS